jgi:hypothetical protein
MKRHLLVFGLVVLLPIAAKADLIFGSNAIVNGNAETGDTSGWTTTGNFTAVQYGDPAAPLANPGDGGRYFFAGGPNTDTDTAFQILNVANASSSINSGNVSYTLSGAFGGYLAENDTASLFVTFFDSNDHVISTSNIIGGHNSTYRNSISQLLYDSTTGTIPIGTQSVEFSLTMTKTEGFYNNAYADNLSFVASQTTPPTSVTPEPSSIFLLGTGTLGIIGCIRRRSVRTRLV